MSATRRLPQISLLLGAVGLSVAAICRESSRERVTKAFGINIPGGIWRLLAICLALINLKNLPFVWHYRLFRSLVYHLFLQPSEIKPQDLFKPIVQITHTPIAEMDYNFHKSNSTYFTDLDIARTHLATAILRKGIRGVKDEKDATFSFRNTSRAAGHKRRGSVSNLGASNHLGPEPGAKGMTEENWYEQATKPGPLLIALGAVTCHFHREIPPYKRYEIWTRLLTWDHKWLYIVSHFVEYGTFKPAGYSLQPGRHSSQRIEHLSEEDKRRLKSKVFASSMAKYVVKKGRLTIPPELVLERSQMLPSRPEGIPVLGGWTPTASRDDTPLRTASRSPEPAVITSDATSQSCSSEFLPAGSAALEDSLVDTANHHLSDKEVWTWEHVQQQRVKGLKLAEAFDCLDGLRESFKLEPGEVLGQYTDLVLDF